MSAGLHHVIEAVQLDTIHDGGFGPWRYRKVTPAVSWAEAQRWHGLLTGSTTRTYRPEHGSIFDGEAWVEYSHRFFFVRAAGDPRWSDLPEPRRYVTGKTEVGVRAARAAARSYGYEGRSGGWIFRVGGDRNVRQGWASMFSLLRSTHRIYAVPDSGSPYNEGRPTLHHGTYFVPSQLLPEPAVAAAAAVAS